MKKEHFITAHSNDKYKKMGVKVYRIIEFLMFFVIIPTSFFWNYPVGIKVGLGVLGFLYVIFLIRKEGALRLKWPARALWKPFLKELGFKLLIIGVVTSCYVCYVAPDKLFQVVLRQPLVWLMILFIYSFFSVWPQEILYRTFFFVRYELLFTSKWKLIVVNAIVFSLAHIFLHSVLVLVLTFLGGLLFAYTYYVRRSTLLVSIEHAIYGNWLFTVGMGEMLAFPS